MPIPEVVTTAELADLRSKIDAVDRQLIELLAERYALSKAAQAHKAAQGIGAYDAERERAMLVERERWAAEKKLPPVSSIFDAVLKTSR